MAKAVVVGAGISGLCSAWHLIKQGWEVTVVSPQEAPSQGCSYGNGGLIVPSHFVPLASPGLVKTGIKLMAQPKGPFGFASLFDFKTLSWVARFLASAKKSHVQRCGPFIRDLNLLGRTEYKSLVSELEVSCGFRQDGLTMVCLDKHAWDEEREFGESGRRLGLDVEFLDNAALRQSDSCFSQAVQGGVRFKDDAQVDPLEMMLVLKQKLVSRGVAFQIGTASSFVVDGGRAKAVSLSDGSELTAHGFVLAAGVWSRELGASLKLNLPLLAGKGYGMNLWTETRPSLPAILVEARVAVTPFADRTRFVGTMELGAKDLSINQARLAGMEEAIKAFYPGLAKLDVKQDGSRDQAWVGMRPCSPDGLPYLGALPHASNIVVAAGHGMMGMSMGPATGLLASQILCGAKLPLDLSLTSPTRHD